MEGMMGMGWQDKVQVRSKFVQLEVADLDAGCNAGIADEGHIRGGLCGASNGSGKVRSRIAVTGQQNSSIQTLGACAPCRQSCRNA